MKKSEHQQMLELMKRYTLLEGHDALHFQHLVSALVTFRYKCDAVLEPDDSMEVSNNEA